MFKLSLKPEWQINLCSLALVLSALIGWTPPCAAATLQPQPVFSSGHTGHLDLLMTARPQDITLRAVNTQIWAYRVCPRPKTGASCPAGTSAPYGGVRLQLQPGDTLRIHLVNRLPAYQNCDDVKHAARNDLGIMLLRNPTNLHTHGLIVEPRRATPALPTYGDYIYVLVENAHQAPAPPATLPLPSCQDTTDPNLSAVGGSHPAGHGAITDIATDAVDYEINVPPKHPAGLFWFHPHGHGVALNQVTAGLAGSITVGEVGQYLCDDLNCAQYSGRNKIDYIMLKDTEVEKGGKLLTQQDPQFCSPMPAASDAPRQGSCPGQQYKADTGEVVDHTGGSWFHTISGQVYPDIPVQPAGDIWRMTNASGSRGYHLQLVDEKTLQPMLVQVLSLDGIAFDVPSGTPLATLRAMVGRKLDLTDCPAQGPAVSPEARRHRGEPVCATGLLMMPSSRAEIWVVQRDAAHGQNLMAAGAGETHAVLRTTMVHTGETDQDGDKWPEIDLASVTFAPRPASPAQPAPYLGVRGQAMATLQPQGLFSTVRLRMPGADQPVDVPSARKLAAQEKPASMPSSLQLAPNGISPQAKLGQPTPGIDCHPLPAGHRRRILFGKVQPGIDSLGQQQPGADSFGLGYEEIDTKTQQPVGPTHPITSFQPDDISICVPVPAQAPANAKPVEEEWELVNLTAEDHNFHIHQTRFRLITAGAGLPPVPGNIQGTAVLQDNVPVPHGTTRQGAASGCDGTIATWRPAGGAQGNCVSPPVVVRIPFNEIGDFVYHCHILEHEDGGMMAQIRVQPTP